MAQAFSYTAAASGATSDIELYVNSGTTATKVFVGVYSNSSGMPGSLLASGSIASPKAGAWNDVSVGQATITQGTAYWIALLPTGGQLNYFDSAGGASATASYVESNEGLSSLPSSYASGDEWTASPASIYVNGQAAAADPAPSNSGVPVVSGSAQQGDVLTTSNGSWSGSPTSYAYQWQDCNGSGASCSGISGATSSSYTLAAGDVGHTVRSVVTATNAGGSTPADSAQTAVVSAPSSVLVGSQQVQSYADSNPAGMAQAFSYTAAASGATSDIELYVNSGTTATKVFVGVYSNSSGMPGSLLASGSIASPKAGAWNDVSVGQATITQGTAYWIALLPTGGQLNYFDSAGGASATASYVESNEGLSSLPSSYASGDEWTASPASIYVNGQAAAADPAPSNSGVPVVSGSAQQGDVLTTSNGSWSGSPTSYAYQWQDCNGSGASCSGISGATSSSYTLAAGDVGHTVRSVVTATNAGGSTPATSAQTATVTSPPAPSNSGVPVVSGSAQQGDVLTTSNGSWSGSPTSYAYQWQDCNGSGASCSGISGATSSSYTLAAGDVGHTVRSVVTATNAGGSTPADSAVSGVVAASGGSGGSPPTTSDGPGVIDTTLLNNYEVPDVVQGSAGSWNNCSGGSSCTYSYQFQTCTGISGTTGTGCTNIGSTPQCSATTATTCNYTLASSEVGDYIVSSVTATTGAGTSSPAVSPAVGQVVASRVNTFCNNAAAFNNTTTGPHLCGWPDSTNTGYVNAPGYPGSLTAEGQPGCPSPSSMQSNQTYEFCKYTGGVALPSGVSNVTFYGDDFQESIPSGNGWPPQLMGDGSNNNIVVNYGTFEPEAVSSPPVTCAESYQYGVENEGATIEGMTVEHSNFWGFAEAVDSAGSTQANPQVFKYNWVHDEASGASPCNYHLDGIGLQNIGTESYATVDHNTIEMPYESNAANLIAWQNGTYTHLTNTNNLLSGDGNGYAVRCTSSCTQPSYITSTGNTYSTYLEAASGESPLDGASNFWSGTGDTWNHNYWAVPPGAYWGTPAYNGYYWLPTGDSSNPNDCGFVGTVDWPNGTPKC